MTSISLEKPKKELLEKHLQMIVGERFPGKSDQHLQEVFRYIKETLQTLGYQIELHSFRALGEMYQNIIARKKGKTSDKRIIIGAHFDSVPGTPGADDNASGVAVMLELARIFSNYSWNHTIEFIGFNLEEWNMLGSSAYAEKLKYEHSQILGMISIEMVGFANDTPGSQKLPPTFGLFYPDVGNFIGVVGNPRSYSLLQKAKSNMKKVRDLPIESMIVPFNGMLFPACRLSDHSPFWDLGYPALLVTDTSFYRNPHYHGPTDRIETLNMDFMLKTTQSLTEAILAFDLS